MTQHLEKIEIAKSILTENNVPFKEEQFSLRFVVNNNSIAIGNWFSGSTMLHFHKQGDYLVFYSQQNLLFKDTLEKEIKHLQENDTTTN